MEIAVDTMQDDYKQDRSTKVKAGIKDESVVFMGYIRWYSEKIGL